MAVLTQAGIRAEVRSRTGDDNSSYYLMSDSVMNTAITSVYTRLFKYAALDAETTIAGSTLYEYTLPAAVNPLMIKSVYTRIGTDISTDMLVIYFKVFNGKIRMPFQVPTGSNIVVQYIRPYTIDDDVPDNVAQIIYMMMEIAWVKYATKRRADFEQWAAINRSDTRISELISLSRDMQSDLDDMAKEFSNRLTVTDAWGGN